jgi:predicted RecB family nuclease
MTSLPLMREIARYNETDCRVMAEILAWLREHP